MTPIFVRPVREQLEHDRLIRFLQARLKRKYEVIANVGDHLQASLKVGAATYYPDLILLDGKKIAGVVEVETGESTNNLEAMAQWTHFSRARVPFHLYVPVPMIDAARRLCDSYGVFASEIWTYRAVNDQFDLVRSHFEANAVKSAIKQFPRTALPSIGKPPAPKPIAPELLPPSPPVASKTSAAAPAKTAAAGKAVPLGKAGAKAPAKPAPVPAASAKGAPAIKAQLTKATTVTKPVAKPVTPAKPVRPVRPVQPAKAPKVTKPTKAAASKAPAKPSKAVRAVKPAPKNKKRK